MTDEQNKLPPMTWFEQQYGEITGLTIEELKERVVRQSLNLFDELNFSGTVNFSDGPKVQDDEFSVWTGSAHKDYIELIAYCRALRKAYDRTEEHNATIANETG